MVSTLETLLKTWNTNDPNERKHLLEQCTTSNVRYIDPHLTQNIQDQTAMLEFLTLFRSRVPHLLEIKGIPDLHHHVFRFEWLLRHPENQSILSTGEFIGEFTGNKISNIIGFLKE